MSTEKTTTPSESDTETTSEQDQLERPSDQELQELERLCTRVARSHWADPDEAEIVAQETLGKVLADWNTDNFRRLRKNPSHWANYVARMASNKHFEEMRKNTRRTNRERRAGGVRERSAPRPGTIRPQQIIPTTPAGAEEFETRDLLIRLSSDLPEQQRKCMQRVFLLEMTPREIAEELGLKVGTVQTHLRKAKKQMRQWLEAEGINAPQ